MSKYDVVLFDLDHTLWDYHKNAEETLTELFDEYIPGSGRPHSELIHIFKAINDELWSDYHNGLIRQYDIRTSRFSRFLNQINFDTTLAETLSEEYIQRGPRKSHLIPHTEEILDYLSQTYSLVIITNGFEETQRIKMEHSRLDKYFPTVITSEKAGSKKPSPEIFYHAMEESGNSGKRAIMVGDNLETDIAGARAAGFDAVHFNPDDKPADDRSTHTITELIQLKEIL